MAAIKTAAAKPTAVETATAETSAKAVGLGRTNANRGGERDSNDRNSHQEFAGHATLVFTFRIRLRHRIFDRYAGPPLACLAKKKCLTCWNTASLLPVWSLMRTNPLLLSLDRFLAF
jgi:hypothetical protein